MKMFDTFFQDPRVKKLKRMPGGDTYIVIMLKLMLQTIKTNGLYEFEELESNLAEELELKIDEDQKAIQVVLDYMAGYGMIIEIKKNHYQIPQVQKMIGSETAAAERKRNQRKREAQKKIKCDNVTPMSLQVTKSHTESEIESEIDYIEREEDSSEIQMMLNSFSTQLEIDIFLNSYTDTLKNITNRDGFIHHLKSQIKNKDRSTLENLLGHYQYKQLKEIQNNG